MKRDERLADPDLSALYKEASDIRSPASLDARVLAAARKAIEPKPRQLHGLLAAAAVIVAGVGIAIQLGDSSSGQAQRATTRSFGERGEARELESSIREQTDAQAESAIQRFNEPRQTATGFDEPRLMSIEASRDCAGNREQADSWRACIEALRAAGLQEAAAAETAAFEQRFPGFHRREPAR